MSFWLDDDENENDDPWSLLLQNTNTQTGSQKSSLLSSVNNSQAPPQPSQQSIHLSSQNKSQQQKQKQTQYQCTNCGGNESYYDDATGTDVCTVCFTQSQVMAASTQQQATETDWDDVMGLAARTAGGHFKQQQQQQKQKAVSVTDEFGNRIIRRRTRVKVENHNNHTQNDDDDDDEYNESIPLPNVQLCLQGMQCVLQQCVNIVVGDILSKRQGWNTNFNSTTPMKNNNSYDDDDDEESYYYEERQRDEMEDSPREKVLLQTLHNTVKEIWLLYLHAWSMGAEYYGIRFPQVRFSFRDLFLSNYQVSYIVRRYIPHRIIKEVQQESGGLTIPDITQSNSSSHQNRQGGNTTSDDDDESPDADEADDDEEECAVDADHITNGEVSAPAKKTKKNSAIRMGAIQKIILQHGPRGNERGYKEVALLLRPSMTMVAAIIYLAITKHENNSSYVTTATAGITYIDVCDWIRTGKLPLMTAYHHLLSLELQKKLYAVRSFFIEDHPIHPSQLESMSSQLCIACRLRIQPKIIEIKNRTNTNKSILGSDGDTNSDTFPSLYPAVVPNQNKLKGVDIRQWEMSNLPYILARFVAMAGLNQNVLDRSLRLIGYTIANRANDALCIIPSIISADQLSRIDELFAIIAIACQLDPQWRDWIYLSIEGEYTISPSIPWHDSEIHTIRNGPSLLQYLKFIDEHLLPENDDQQRSFNSTDVSLLPTQYIAAMKSLSNIWSTNPTNINTEPEVNQGQRLVIRPCRVLAGAVAPHTIEVTNRTCKLPVDRITEHYHKKRNQDQPQSNNVATTTEQRPDHSMTTRKRQRDEVKLQIRKQTKNQKQQFRRTECDEMYALPNHDFYKGDRCNNDWEVSGDIDIDQMRLIQYLAYVSDMNPYHIHRSMNVLLRRPK